MKVNELPDGLRLKLSESDERLLWQKVSEKGVNKAAAETGYPRNRIYSWKSKNLFIPGEFVTEFMDSPEISAMKSGGRGSEISSVNFPIPENSELLTRIGESVYTNKEGVPFYRTDEFSLAQRFRQLLYEIGDFDVSIYRRQYYELRYPKVVQDILSEMSFDQHLPALVDESGVIKEGYIHIEGETIPVDDFKGTLYSDRKRQQLAIERGDEDELARIISDQVSKANELL